VGVACGDQVAVPAQHGLGAHQQPDLVWYVAGNSVQQGSKVGPVGRGEPGGRAVQLPFEDGDLVAQGEDLHVLGAIAHGQQAQHRQRVGHTEVRESKEHSMTSSPIDPQPYHQPGAARSEQDPVAVAKLR
jgi:hypothetical protein